MIKPDFFLVHIMIPVCIYAAIVYVAMEFLK